MFGVGPMFPPQPAHLLHQEQGCAVMVGFCLGFPHVRLCHPPDNHPAPALPILLCHWHAPPICHHWGHLQKGKRPQELDLGLSRLGISCPIHVASSVCFLADNPLVYDQYFRLLSCQWLHCGWWKDNQTLVEGGSSACGADTSWGRTVWRQLGVQAKGPRTRNNWCPQRYHPTTNKMGH